MSSPVIENCSSSGFERVVVAPCLQTSNYESRKNPQSMEESCCMWSKAPTADHDTVVQSNESESEQEPYIIKKRSGQSCVRREPLV